MKPLNFGHLVKKPTPKSQTEQIGQNDNIYMGKTRLEPTRNVFYRKQQFSNGHKNNSIDPIDLKFCLLA